MEHVDLRTKEGSSLFYIKEEKNAHLLGEQLERRTIPLSGVLHEKGKALVTGSSAYTRASWKRGGGGFGRKRKKSFYY